MSDEPTTGISFEDYHRLVMQCNHLNDELRVMELSLFEALRELPSGMREIPFDKYNELMRNWRKERARINECLARLRLNDNGI